MTSISRPAYEALQQRAAAVGCRLTTADDGTYQFALTPDGDPLTYREIRHVEMLLGSLERPAPRRDRMRTDGERRDVLVRALAAHYEVALDLEQAPTIPLLLAAAYSGAQLGLTAAEYTSLCEQIGRDIAADPVDISEQLDMIATVLDVLEGVR